jgi:hypothetical protein
MTLMRPRATVTLDGRTLSSAEAALVRAEVSLTVRGGHDAATLLVWPRSKLVSADPGSTLSIALGNAGEEEDVWTGEVTNVSAGQDGFVIDGLSATIALSRLRVTRVYVDQSVADIVNDLASDIDIDEVEGDTSLDGYAVDDRRPLWMQLQALAELTGAELGSSASGGLRFVLPRTGSADVTLRYGADVLSWSGGSAPKRVPASVAAFGAASESGAEQWHWLLREPAAAGGDGPTRVVAALKTRDAAESMANELARRAKRAAVHARLVIVGNETLRPGDLIEVDDLPSGDLGTLRVLDVQHVLDGRTGFTTALTVEGAGS